MYITYTSTKVQHGSFLFNLNHTPYGIVALVPARPTITPLTTSAPFNSLQSPPTPHASQHYRRGPRFVISLFNSYCILNSIPDALLFQRGLARIRDGDATPLCHPGSGIVGGSSFQLGCRSGHGCALIIARTLSLFRNTATTGYHCD
jgi:hypothetical protein